ncbi:MAG: helix-turn-helix domain-containing protein [Hyphomicrobiaceae bacterium]
MTSGRTYGERVRQARLHKGLTQVDLAAKIGATAAAVSRMEVIDKCQGSRFTCRIATACDVDPLWLETGAGEHENAPECADNLAMSMKKESGRRLRGARIAAGFRTLDELAAASGDRFSVSRLGNYEIGHRAMSPEVAKELAGLVRRSAAWLLCLDDDDLKPDEKALLSHYRAADERGKSTISRIAEMESTGLGSRRTGRHRDGKGAHEHPGLIITGRQEPNVNEKHRRDAHAHHSVGRLREPCKIQHAQRQTTGALSRDGSG